MVQHLVEDMTAIGTLVHIQTFIAATASYQVEYKTRKQPLLGLTVSHLMRWRWFISPESHDSENR